MKNPFRKLFASKTPDNPYVPPAHLHFVGEADFERLGQKFLRFFTELGGLEPNHRVLDIGSGNGRMAYPLTSFLQDGEYHGQEIVKEAVEWCQNTYASHSNFHFFHADIHSKRYNPQGSLTAATYRFPFDDQHFDFIFLTSVFTHMLQGDMANYLREISRLLKPGGRCFITLFLINEESLTLLKKGKTKEAFKKYKDNSYTSTTANPESAMAFEEDYFMTLLHENKLALVGPVHYGRWCGRKNFTAYQDILVAEKMA